MSKNVRLASVRTSATFSAFQADRPDGSELRRNFLLMQNTSATEECVCDREIVFVAGTHRCKNIPRIAGPKGTRHLKSRVLTPKLPHHDRSLTL